jgi:glycosyltransferase involved in cell wall biosynthesis
MTTPAATPPVVSVVLPTFNRVKYLRPAVESVFAQTFQDWEMIIADDGSDEETQAYLRTVESLPRAKVIRLPHSGNPGVVRNAALREARGEYVAFLDSDDLWLPEKLELQIGALRSAGGPRWNYTGYSWINGAGETTVYPGPRRWVPHKGAIFTKLLTFEADVLTPAVVVERRLLAEIGGFDEGLTLLEDYDVWQRLALHSEVGVIERPLVCMRRHDQNYPGTRMRMVTSRDRMLHKLQHLVSDSRLLVSVKRARAQNAVDLAMARADTDRLAALTTLLRSWPYSWRCARWWTGAVRVSVKIVAPRRMVAAYRRRRTLSASGG